MSMFNLKEVNEEVKGGVNETYIYPGIRNRVVIKKWTHGVQSNEKKTPFVSIHLVTQEGKAANVEPKEFKFYMSEKAMPTSLAKIKHIVTKVTTQAKFEAKEPSDMEELVDHLNDISQGSVLRMKFNGREYLNASQEIKEAAEIGLPEFAEAVEDGAEYPAVADENTGLTFNKENKNDFQKLDVVASNPAETKASADVSW